MGSISGSSSQDQEEEPPPPPPQPPPIIDTRQLLITCADLISRSDLSSAHRLLAILSTNSSPYGDSTQRSAHQFTRALALRLNYHFATAHNNIMSHYILRQNNDAALIQSSYLSLNQLTPFLRFTHLTANQAILEAIHSHQPIHVIDLDITHGLQWPPFMQALAQRYPPPQLLRITGAGTDLHTLRRTGDRLAKFAHSLGLRFQFHPLILNEEEEDHHFDSSILLQPDETLAVNCVHYLHRLLGDDPDHNRLRHFLHRIKAMRPRVVTVGEREANHNLPIFQQRFVEALGHYGAVFDSLEATVPPNSGERLSVENVWFGREIADIVAAAPEGEYLRHERFGRWEEMILRAGFRNIPLSAFALSQAKLLLRIHYPSEGYRLHVCNHSFFLGWLNHPLFSVSSWH